MYTWIEPHPSIYHPVQYHPRVRWIVLSEATSTSTASRKRRTRWKGSHQMTQRVKPEAEESEWTHILPLALRISSHPYSRPYYLTRKQIPDRYASPKFVHRRADLLAFVHRGGGGGGERRHPCVREAGYASRPGLVSSDMRVRWKRRICAGLHTRGRRIRVKKSRNPHISGRGRGARGTPCADGVAGRRYLLCKCEFEFNRTPPYPIKLASVTVEARRRRTYTVEPPAAIEMELGLTNWSSLVVVTGGAAAEAGRVRVRLHAVIRRNWMQQTRIASLVQTPDCGQSRSQPAPVVQYEPQKSKESAAAEGGRGEEKKDLYGKRFLATDMDPVKENGRKRT
ncbi:hypothetical protein B0H13DRAFT_2290200 [Mycena leptocephala]|nr:hypothetical protein B0H13DRAFT_2290200 [Mycena leptocephala]